MKSDNIDLLKDAHGRSADPQPASGCCGSGSCGSCDSPAPTSHAALGDVSDMSGIGLSCGSPVLYARLCHGETVLVLGSGSGRDVFAAAAAVGRTGRVTGVEMSPQMLALARDGEAAFQEESALYNTEFREGRIEDLPLFDNSVEVVLSNCVLKLAANRTQACREAFRVLKPGGRLVLCDLVLAPDSRCDVPGQRNDAAQGIVDAISCDEFLAGIRAAGFDGLEILSLQRYVSEQDCGSSVNNGRESLPTQQVACLALLAIKAV